VKTIETRTFKTNYRGLLGIHAGLQIDAYGPWERFSNGVVLPTGALLGTVELYDCRPMRPDDAGAAYCPWSEDLFSWVVTGATAFNAPISMKGRLGIWECKVP
jgi:hypothetical protein